MMFYKDGTPMTTWERVGFERGLKLGRLEVRFGIIMKLLTIKFGELPDDVLDEMLQIEDEKAILEIGVKLLFADSLDEIFGDEINDVGENDFTPTNK